MMLPTGEHLGVKPALTGTQYFHVAEVGNLYESVKDKADLVWPLEAGAIRRERGDGRYGLAGGVCW